MTKQLFGIWWSDLKTAKIEYWVPLWKHFKSWHGLCCTSTPTVRPHFLAMLAHLMYSEMVPALFQWRVQTNIGYIAIKVNTNVHGAKRWIFMILVTQNLTSPVTPSWGSQPITFLSKLCWSCDFASASVYFMGLNANKMMKLLLLLRLCANLSIVFVKTNSFCYV